MRRFVWLIYAILLLGSGMVHAKLTQPQQSSTAPYTVRSGDTLYSIAHAHHTTIKELLEANRLERNAVIKVGQTLNVPLNTYFPERSSSQTTQLPQKETAPEGMVDYTVQSGDTLFIIARKHHTSIRELLEANQLERNAVIKVGQHLRVPTDTYPPQTPTARKIAPKAPRRANVRTPAAAPAGDKGTYVVKSGDTLFSIARKNHILLGKLMKLNGIGLGTQLHAGQVLRVNGQQTYVADAVPAKTPKKRTTGLPVGAMPSYTVKKGDTLWQIAKDHHLTLAQIRKLNKMSKSDRIHTGMVLAVGKPVQPKKKTYKVKKGDTLWLIAKKHGMTTQQLRTINGLKRKDTIHTGMVLALQDGVSVPKKKTVSQEERIVARLKKKGAKKEDIQAVLARIKKSKQKNPDIEAILAQVQKKKRTTQPVQTPLRVTKKSKTRKGRRYDSAMAMLNNKRGSRTSRSNERVIRVAKRYLGRRYVWGAEGPNVFDCSGFTQYVMRKSKGVNLPRVSRKQAYYGKYVSRSHLRPGDLVFFDTSRRRRGYVNHVGIYIGNNKFIHASSGKHRVVITSLDRPFYRSRFKWGRRVN